VELTSRGTWQIAEYLGNSGSRTAARDLFRPIADAHAISEDYVPEHRDTLAARTSLAGSTGGGGRHGPGRRTSTRQLLPVLELVFGPEHPATLSTRQQLAYWRGQADRGASEFRSGCLIFGPAPAPPATCARDWLIWHDALRARVRLLDRARGRGWKWCSLR
jgi:hypothetical protein